MPTSVSTTTRNSETVYLLSTDHARAEVWPGRGFNCVRWQIQHDGQWRDILFAMPDWGENPVPTRSGNPVLFPFPNRLAAGRMTWEGKVYQLPINDASKSHAIHGFTPREPWRVLGSGCQDDSVWIVGRNRISDRDHPWPGDLSLTLTYRLHRDSLQLDATVENHVNVSSPYGLGYHAYFRHPLAAVDEPIDLCHYHSPASKVWDCVDNLPTGMISTVPRELDFQLPRALGSTHFDTLLTGLPVHGMTTIGAISHPIHPGRVEVRADPSFPHMVTFTPQHRQAIAIEPYTCATNATNLSDDFPHGWKTLTPGEKIQHRVEYRWILAAT